MKPFDLYGGLFWLIVALFVSGASVLKFGLGDFHSPGPGFFPFLVGMLLLVLSIAMITGAVKERTKDSAWEWPAFPGKIFMTLLVLFVFALSLERLGYVVGSFLLFLYLFKFPAGKRWASSLVLSILVAAITYYFFGVLLKTQFPKGILNI